MNQIRLRIRVCRNGVLSALAQALMAVGFALIFGSGFARAAEPAFKVLAFYSTDVEPDHVKTAKDAHAFYSDLATKDNFILDTTTDWTKLNENDLKPYRLILWLNNFPQTPDQRAAFEKYMRDGGGWIGFHVAAYNDKDTHWPWFVSNYPIGQKDIITEGDLPINMGHGPAVYGDPTQNKLFENAILWLGKKK